MSVEVIIGIGLLLIMLALVTIGLEIAWAIGISATVGLILTGQSFNQFSYSSWNALNSYVLTAAPLFMLMGSLLGNSGISEYLYSGAEKWLGRFPGSLAAATIAASAMFGAMCGSSMASTATFGKIALPSMEKRNYDPKMALGSVAMGAVLSPLIPPSTLLIIYGMWQHISILDLFAAAYIPGLTLTGFYILTIVIWTKINPKAAPSAGRFSFKEKVSSTKDILPFGGVILVVFVFMFGGVMTPSECAGLGVILSIIVTLYFKKLNYSIFKKTLMGTAQTMSMAFIIYVMALSLVHVFNILGVIEKVSGFMLNLQIGKYGVIGIFFIMYFILGCFFDSWAMLFLTFSFVVPVIVALGLDPVWWGVVYVMLGEQSAVTPPYGLNLFVLRGVAPQHPMGTVVRGSLLFMPALLANIFLLTAFPQIAMWLPNLLRSYASH